MSSGYKNEYVLSQKELDEAMARGRQIRAEAFRYAMVEIGHGVANLFRRIRGVAPTTTVTAS